MLTDMEYKASQFNVFFQHDGNQIGFNCYSREFIVLDPLLMELYNSGSKRNAFIELADVHPEFYSFLIEKGFLVESGVDEFQVVKNLSRKIDSDDSMFELIINPTMNCNFKCWYCYETHIKDSKMDSTTISAVIALAANVIANQKGLKYFRISFFGGEPLLYFDKVIDPILRQVSQLCKEANIGFGAGMTTNGLLINDSMLNVCSEFGLQGFQITLDGNRQQHDKVRFISEGRGSYDKIVSNIILAAKYGRRVSVRINCSADTLINIEEILEDFNVLSEEERTFINFDFHRVWQIQENIELELDTSRQEFKDSGFRVDRGAHDTVVNSCYGDKRYQATVNYNGEVFKCTARDFKNGSGEGTLNADGSIAWNEKYEKRLSAKFNNGPCKTCKILPICGGGCSQQAIEHEGVDYCVHDYDEKSKEQQVVRRFLSVIA